MQRAAPSSPAGEPATQESPTGEPATRVPAAGSPAVWTQDDIIVSAAETFALLPRPSGAAMEAFTALLTEYWPSTSADARAQVSSTLRGSRRVSARVVAVLDAVSAAPVASKPRMARDMTVRASSRPLSRRRVAPPPLAAEADDAPLAATMWAEMNDQDRMTEDLMPALDAIWDADAASDVAGADETGAAHARAVLRRVALTGERGPVVQPRSIAERLEGAEHHADALADLLHLPREEGRAVLGNVPGTLIALRTLGIAAQRAVRLAAKWHGVDPAPLLPAYRGLRLTQCLDAVSEWRTVAAREEAVANDGGLERVFLTG